MIRIPRLAARAVVCDPDGSVFLFRYDNVEVGVHWAPPGGGVEPGETPRTAAARELAEETGWTDVEIGPEWFVWEHDYTRANDGPVRQLEHVYRAHGPRRDPDGATAAAWREDGILQARWWTPGELARAREAMWPPQLSVLLDDLLRDGPPARPLDLGLNPVGDVGASTKGAADRR